VALTTKEEVGFVFLASGAVEGQVKIEPLWPVVSAGNTAPWVGAGKELHHPAFYAKTPVGLLGHVSLLYHQGV
jgi:hypothetical protein